MTHELSPQTLDLVKAFKVGFIDKKSLKDDVKRRKRKFAGSAEALRTKMVRAITKQEPPQAYQTVMNYFNEAGFDVTGTKVKALTKTGLTIRANDRFNELGNMIVKATQRVERLRIDPESQAHGSWVTLTPYTPPSPFSS